MRLLIISIMELLCFPLFATNYYLSSSSGSDLNTGMSPSSAWTSLQMVNTLSLAAGDSVLLKRGDVFRGTIVINESGNADSVIYIGAYGAGEKPVILGSEKVNAFWLATTVNNQTAYKTNFPSFPSFIYIDGKLHFIARHPDGFDSYFFTDFPNIFSGTYSAVRADTLAGYTGDVAGAYISLRRNGWLCDTRVVDSMSANGTIYFSPSMTFSGNNTNSVGFILSNKLSFLDQPGEFYYDASDSTVYVIPYYEQTPSDNTEASVYDFGIFMDTSVTVSGFRQGLGFITIENISFRYQAIAGIGLSDENQNVTIRNCSFAQLPFGVTNREIYDHYNDGLFRPMRSYDITVENNDVKDAYRAGFNITFAIGAVVRNNHLKRIHLFVNAAEWLRQKDFPYGAHVAALEAQGWGNMLIENNTIDSCGHYGIKMGSDVITQHNIVKNTCYLYMDCGAIYCAYQSNAVIRGNIVENVWNGDNGIPNHADNANGIYLDYLIKANNENVLVTGNTIINAGQGMGCLGGASLWDINRVRPNMRIENNVCYNSRNSAFVLGIRGADPAVYTLPPTSPVNFKRNRWVGFSQMPLWSWHNLYSDWRFWESDSNYFFNPYNHNKAYADFPSTTFQYDFALWQSQGYDSLGKENFVWLDSITTPPSEMFPIFVNETAQTAHFLLSPDCYLDLDSNLMGSSIAVPPFSSVVLVKVDSCSSVCAVPDSLEVTDISDSSAVLRWSAVNGATYFEILFRATGASVWDTFSLSSAISDTALTGLLPATEYEWVLKTHCDSLNLFQSGFSSAISFTTLQDTVPVSTGAMALSFDAVVIPNPFSTHARLLFDNPTGKTYTLTITDLAGKAIMRMQTGENNFSLNKENLCPGIYLYELKGEKTARGKFAVI